MKKINLIHLGIGNVGKALVSQIQDNKKTLKEKYNLVLNYCGIFNSKGGIFDQGGLTKENLTYFPQNLNIKIGEVLKKVQKPFILIDTTASDETYPYVISALKNGGGAVLSNKRPLSSSQYKFDELHRKAQGRLFYETTVGAALPVISTLKDLVDTGDEIIEIKGCFSGTLGFLFSQLEEGKSFSEAVLEAKNLGFTEPDPRDDLSGLDVARKALILIRLIGAKFELSNIKLTSLYPKKMQNMSVDKFLDSAKVLDDEYKGRFKEEKKKGRTLRYIANIKPNLCKVDIESVEKDSDLGALKGPDNLIVFQTKRYFGRPLVVKGPGAGVEVTASGVFADILKLVRIFPYEKN